MLVMVLNGSFDASGIEYRNRFLFLFYIGIASTLIPFDIQRLLLEGQRERLDFFVCLSVSHRTRVSSSIRHQYVRGAERRRESILRGCFPAARATGAAGGPLVAFCRQWGYFGVASDKSAYDMCPTCSGRRTAFSIVLVVTLSSNGKKQGVSSVDFTMKEAVC